MVPETSCRYCTWVEPHSFNNESGVCHRTPPEYSSVQLDTDWCGEFLDRGYDLVVEELQEEVKEEVKEKTNKWKFWNILKIRKKICNGEEDSS